MTMNTVEVAYATPEKQLILTVQVPAGTTVEQCIEQSGIQQHFSDIDLSQQKVGIWNKTTKLDTEPRDGDRIEIYRALIADPKAVRKRRAEKAKQEGRADKVTGGRPDAKRNQRSKE
ncbi:MAG: RnfH family protein [Pseudomonadota bacterium]